MSNPRYPLRINVGIVFHQPNGTHRDFHFELPGLQLSPGLDVCNFIGTARISRTTQGLLVQGDFQGQTEAECVRCLSESILVLHSEFTELFTFPKNSLYEPQPVEDPELVLQDDGYMDLAPLVREYLLLEIPIKFLCRPDCEGLCSLCGTNLNESKCTHQSSPAVTASVQPGS